MTYQPIPRVLSQPTPEARERAGDTWERLKPGMLGPVKVRPPGRSLAEQSADPLPPLTWARPEVQAHLESGKSLKSLIARLRELGDRPEVQKADPLPPLSDEAKRRVFSENACGND